MTIFEDDGDAVLWECDCCLESRETYGELPDGWLETDDEDHLCKVCAETYEEPAHD